MGSNTSDCHTLLPAARITARALTPALPCSVTERPVSCSRPVLLSLKSLFHRLLLKFPAPSSSSSSRLPTRDAPLPTFKGHISVLPQVLSRAYWASRPPGPSPERALPSSPPYCARARYLPVGLPRRRPCPNHCMQHARQSFSLGPGSAALGRASNRGSLTQLLASMFLSSF